LRATLNFGFQNGKPLPISSDFLFLHQTGEVLERAIISFLSLPWEAATGQLATFHVILETLTADAFSGARVIAAITAL
jgi:hypothetical protein